MSTFDAEAHPPTPGTRPSTSTSPGATASDCSTARTGATAGEGASVGESVVVYTIFGAAVFRMPPLMTAMQRERDDPVGWCDAGLHGQRLADKNSGKPCRHCVRVGLIPDPQVA